MGGAQARRPPLGTQLFQIHVAIDFIRSLHVTMPTLMWVAHWTWIWWPFGSFPPFQWRAQFSSRWFCHAFPMKVFYTLWFETKQVIWSLLLMLGKKIFWRLRWRSEIGEEDEFPHSMTFAVSCFQYELLHFMIWGLKGMKSKWFVSSDPIEGSHPKRCLV